MDVRYRKKRVRSRIEIVFTFPDGSTRRWYPAKHGNRIDLPGAIRAVRVDRVRVSPAGKT